MQPCGESTHIRKRDREEHVYRISANVNKEHKHTNAAETDVFRCNRGFVHIKSCSRSKTIGDGCFLDSHASFHGSQ
ncbi:hypothetical protein L596_001935 [Steinernema carpocapsae]|uniref:Uncharacterized protein n=1 Tax=Steinernema carpocapsae TaxID=34508 RepID=A0A4U8UMJ4_STECR|nr:hypothetical protein L596_001935 [Steinernema carpocapsae]